jgi:hypothetical protein
MWRRVSDSPMKIVKQLEDCGHLGVGTVNGSYSQNS